MDQCSFCDKFSEAVKQMFTTPNANFCSECFDKIAEKRAAVFTIEHARTAFTYAGKNASEQKDHDAADD